MMENRELRAALVGRFVELYQIDAQFHAAIETLSLLLPYWVEGLAAEAEQRQEDLEEAITRLSAYPDAKNQVGEPG